MNKTRAVIGSGYFYAQKEEKMKKLETNYVPVVRVYAVKERYLPYGKEAVSHPKDVVKLVQRLLEGADREYLLVIPVDAQSKPVGVEIVSIGTLNAALVEAREIFKHAILSNAAGIVMAHNHPSGNPQPSNHDIKITKKMKLAGDILGIELLDHIIIGDEDEFVSLAEMGEIETLIV